MHEELRQKMDGFLPHVTPQPKHVSTTPDATAKHQADAQIEDQTETRTNSQIETQLESQAKDKENAQLEAQANAQVKTQAPDQADAQVETQAPNQANAQLEPQVEPQPEAQTNPQAELQTAAQLEPQEAPHTQPESAPTPLSPDTSNPLFHHAPTSNLYVPSKYRESHVHFNRSVLARAKNLSFITKTTLIALFAACIVSTTIVTKCFGLLQGQEIKSVVGESENTARQELESESFQVRVETQTTASSDQIGRVISSSPAAGDHALPGATVTIKVGKALAETHEVPSLVGKTEQDASDAILGTSFFVKDTVSYTHDERAQKGTVIAQDPQPHEMKTKGSGIKLIVAE